MMNEQELVSVIQTKLKRYHPSEETQDILVKARILLLVGITGAGKGSIIQELLKTGRYYFIVSHTTRQPRINNGVPEQDGREYFFITNEQLERKLNMGEFVECKFIHNQQFSGTSIKEIQSALAANKIAVTDIEVQGVAEYMKLKKDTKAIFVLPPSYEVWEERFRGRGQATKEDIENRYKSAAMEISTALERDYYHFVINDNLADAVTEIDRIARGDSEKLENETGRAIAQQMLDRLQEILKD